MQTGRAVKDYKIRARGSANQLVASGQWPAFRGRPYGRSVPPKGKQPKPFS